VPTFAGFGEPANKGPVPKAWAFLFAHFPDCRTRSEDSADRIGRKSPTDVLRQECVFCSSIAYASLFLSWSLVFQFLFFYATFQPKISNRSEISKKSFTLTVNLFKSIFQPLVSTVSNQLHNLTSNFLMCGMRRSYRKWLTWETYRRDSQIPLEAFLISSNIKKRNVRTKKPIPFKNRLAFYP
jgi:hypothetical protein